VVGPDTSGGIVHRDGLRTLQTPQVFSREALVEAHRRAAGELDGAGALEAASDAVLLERAGFAVAVVPGEPGNLAIATTLDFEVAEVLAARDRAVR
jgi:2-C-methyl-D-erythritol 4-phosphate cytidylyltransferase